jgi:hypothetical protein
MKTATNLLAITVGLMYLRPGTEVTIEVDLVDDASGDDVFDSLLAGGMCPLLQRVDPPKGFDLAFGPINPCSPHGLAALDLEAKPPVRVKLHGRQNAKAKAEAAEALLLGRLNLAPASETEDEPADDGKPADDEKTDDGKPGDDGKPADDDKPDDEAKPQDQPPAADGAGSPLTLTP